VKSDYHIFVQNNLRIAAIWDPSVICKNVGILFPSPCSVFAMELVANTQRYEFHSVLLQVCMVAMTVKLIRIYCDKGFWL